jgi:hypothetical protein
LLGSIFRVGIYDQEIGTRCRVRTGDPQIKSLLLYQLS